MTDDTESPKPQPKTTIPDDNHSSGLLDIPLEFTGMQTSGSFEESNPELSYRRGFVHGAYAALYLHMKGVRAERVRKWVLGDLARWREKGLRERIRTGSVTRSLPPVILP
jgi:hypothetical protein